jgi:hypothetical protein
VFDSSDNSLSVIIRSDAYSGVADKTEAAITSCAVRYDFLGFIIVIPLLALVAGMP